MRASHPADVAPVALVADLMPVALVADLMPVALVADAKPLTTGAVPEHRVIPAADERDPPRRPIQIARDIALFFAAPFVTLAYLALFPFIAMILLRRARRHAKPAT